jgi:hypothetical protein
VALAGLPVLADLVVVEVLAVLVVVEVLADLVLLQLLRSCPSWILYVFLGLLAFPYLIDHAVSS